MKIRAHYDPLAPYYDKLYAWKNYKGEGQKLRRLIKRYSRSGGRELLEMACGTGGHMGYLKDRFTITACDLSAGMLAAARKKHPEVKFQRADMVDFELKKKFDVLLCLFSSVGYVKTLPRLKKTIVNFARHLKPGGVVIIEPWFMPSVLKPGRPGMTLFQSEDLKIARLNDMQVKGRLSVMEMQYLVAAKNKPVQHFKDRHEMGLFTQAETLGFMRGAGLKALYLKDGLMDGRGLYVGIKAGKVGHS